MVARYRAVDVSAPRCANSIISLAVTSAAGSRSAPTHRIPFRGCGTSRQFARSWPFSARLFWKRRQYLSFKPKPYGKPARASSRSLRDLSFNASYSGMRTFNRSPRASSSGLVAGSGSVAAMATAGTAKAGNPSRFVFCQQIGCGSAAGIDLVIGIGQRLPVVVPHNKARAVVIDRPGCGEAAGRHRPLRTNREQGI